MPSCVTRLLSNWKLFAVVAARASYSSFMLPAYCVESPTFSKFFLSNSKFVNMGAMAVTLSFPKIVVSTAVCLDFSTLLMAVSTRMMVPCASCCMPLATSRESSRNALNVSCCFLVAAEPTVMASMKFFMPVPATSSAVPMPIRVDAMAAICPLASPATSPSGPICVTTALICLAVAGPVLPR